MTKKEQERLINRILLTMTIGFCFEILMYYMHGSLANGWISPIATFWTMFGVFAAAFVILAVVYVVCCKNNQVSLIRGYRENLKIRSLGNFQLLSIVCATLSLVCLFVGYGKVMPIIAWGIGGYIVVLIAISMIYQSIMNKRVKTAKVSKKAAAKAAKRALYKK